MCWPEVSGGAVGGAAVLDGCSLWVGGSSWSEVHHTVVDEMTEEGHPLADDLVLRCPLLDSSPPASWLPW